MQRNYVLADGDDIGSKLELMLLDGDITSARRFSQEVDSAIKESASILMETVGTELVFIGGDGFLATIPADRLDTAICERVQARFQQLCGCTLSIGIGLDPASTAHALRRAKLLGKNRVILLEADRAV